MPRARRGSTTGTRKSTSGTRKKKSAAKAAAAPRRSRTPARAAAMTAATGAFVCPECGRTFDRAASLGAHRNRAHGIAGGARAGRRRNGATPRAAASSSAGARGVDRDALLAALFPKGIPARESVIRQLNGWLDQAEKLARLG